MKKNSPQNAVILLSGGLDSLISLTCAENEGIDIKLALTFDYGQKAAADEISAAEKIAKFYNIKHRVIKLSFLGEISNSALNDKKAGVEFETLNQESADAVWVPNRNGLFMNIAASFCDAFGYNFIIFGANKEEGETFPDNSKDFIERTNAVLEFSTKTKPKIYAPLKDFEKYEIINKGIELKAEFKLLKSCYNDTVNGKTHCGRCESCKRLKNAILKSHNKDLIKLFF